MSYSIDKLPNEPILIMSHDENHNIHTDGDQALIDIFNALDSQEEQIYLIFDISKATFGLEDAMQGAGQATQQYKLFKHPRIIENVVITNSRLMQLMAQGLSAPIFGSLHIRTFESRSAALAYIRNQTAKQGR